MEYLGLAVLGLGAAAAYALLSLGLVLIYRASGVLNFAQGALAMTGAYIFYELRVIHGWPYVPAVLVGVVLTSILGAIIYLLLMRPLRNASALVRIVATLGVLAVIDAVATLRYTSTTLSVPEALPQRVIHFVVTFPEDRIWLIGIAAVLTMILHWISNKTTFGLATRAVAESQHKAAAVGWSPDVVAASNWALGSALAALAGILIVPISSLSVTNLTLLIVPALGVAMFGGFSSFPLTFLGAIMLGMAQGSVTLLDTRVTGLSDSLPFALILIALVIRRQAIPQRGEVQQRLPSLGTGDAGLAVVVAGLIAGVIGALYLPLTWSIAFGVSVVAGIILLSVVVVTGYAGQLSLGQYALAGTGALIAAQIVTNVHWPFPVAILFGVLGAMAVGFIFGLPSLRSRGAALAIVTLGMGAAINSIVFNNSALSGGPLGFSVTSQSFFGISLNPISAPRTYTVFCLCWFALAVLVVRNLRRSSVGRRLITIRANERAAASLGVNVGGAKLYAFVISAGIAALGGVLLAFAGSSIVLSSGYDSLASIQGVTQAVVGGVAHISGSVAGAQLTPGGLPAGVIASYFTGPNDGGEWLALIGGVLLLVTLLLNPDGIAGALTHLAHRLRARLKRSAAVGVDIQHVGSAGSGSGAPSAGGQGLAPSARLSIRGLSVNFGGVYALKDVDLTLASGEIVGLIGPNGAGKTTLIDGVTGYVRSSGSVAVDGLRLDGLPPFRRTRAGVTRSFQSLELFDDLTVEENLRAAAEKEKAFDYVMALLPARRRESPQIVRSVIQSFHLEGSASLYPRELSYAQRRIVALARAVASKPKFLLLDEPAAGLEASEGAALGASIREIAAWWNIGVLLIEHDMSVVMETCDRVAVLEFGSKIAEGTPAEVQADSHVIAAYLGVSESDALLDVAADAVAGEDV
jgi:ABC-type branched-subunit amino acid transport system ATPase component/branched-subunit amino acid ABC-type transport system permease component